MIDALGFAAGLISILIGAILVHDAVSRVGPNESMVLIGGALLLSVGLVGVSLAGRTWLEWRRTFKDDNNSASAR
jgi:hypothetical protein